jgi:tRNA/rRNA methyltransferase
MKPPPAFGRVRVVLVKTSHPGNIGAAARAMKTMGLARLFLVNPRRFPDAEASARAAGATDVLEQAIVCGDLAEALQGTVFAAALTARVRELGVEPRWAREGAALLAGAAGQGDVALVFGSERYGLSNDEVGLCGLPLMIPTDPDFGSLNLGAAVQVMCYELRLALLDPGAPPPVAGAGRPASHEDVERLLAHLEQAAIGSGFLDPAQPKRLMARMRRLFARAGLENEEVAILRGMLAAFEKKVD